MENNKLFPLSPTLIRVTEITFESLESLSGLIKGLQFIAWEYLAENIDTGIDGQIDGAFLRDFYDLLEYLQSVDEELKKP